MKTSARRVSLCLAACLCLFGTGCTNVTPSPSGPPSQEAPTASVGPSVPSATAATDSPPSGSSASPSEPSPSPTEPGFHADTALFTDDFSDSSSQSWGTGTQDTGSIAYAEGGLRIDFAQPVNSLWSWRLLGDTWNVVRVSGRVTLATGSGSAGWMCGATANDLVAAVVNTAGEWVFVEVEGRPGSRPRSTSLQSGRLPDGVAAGTSHLLTLECAGSATGALRLRMLVDEVEVATFERGNGLERFDRVAAYADTTEAGFAATFDDAAVTGGDTFGGFPSPAP